MEPRCLSYLDILEDLIKVKLRKMLSSISLFQSSPYVSIFTKSVLWPSDNRKVKVLSSKFGCILVHSLFKYILLSEYCSFHKDLTSNYQIDII